MSQRIVIDPVTRIEGHAKVTLQLDSEGRVADARFHVTEFRGFEKFLEGRPLFEMPGITARVCGICPVSHALASAKAGDQILSIQVPPAADKLRRLMNLGQIVQSHALSVFHLSAPDLVLGFDSEPAQRNLFGLIAAEPEYARGGIRLRQFGQRLMEILGGRKIHSSWAVPGGVRSALDDPGRREIAARLPAELGFARVALERWKRLLDGFGDEVEGFGRFPSLFLGLIGPDDRWEHHDGNLRVIDDSGRVVSEFSAEDYPRFLEETVDFGSFMKPAFYRPLGFPGGVYRVGPLARINLCRRMDAPEADRELVEFRQRFPPPATSSFLYHHARLIEIIACLELIGRAIDDPELGSDRLRARARANRAQGVGVSEAPRGTLLHHYTVDDDGLVTRANLLIATAQNHAAINRTVLQIAQRLVRGAAIPEGVLNRIEAGVRAFDPCLSCSTHAVGRMPLVVELRAADGALLDRRQRPGAA